MGNEGGWREKGEGTNTREMGLRDSIILFVGRECGGVLIEFTSLKLNKSFFPFNVEKSIIIIEWQKLLPRLQEKGRRKVLWFLKFFLYH